VPEPPVRGASADDPRVATPFGSRFSCDEVKSFLARGLGYAYERFHPSRRLGVKKLLTLAPIAALLAACEDAGNSGNDNLLTGGSLVLIVIIVIIVILVRRRR
jgi:hypothetical protein